MMRPALLLALTAAYTTVAAPFCTDSFETPSADWAPDGRYWSYSGTAANGGKSLMRVLYKGGKALRSIVAPESKARIEEFLRGEQ